MSTTLSSPVRSYDFCSYPRPYFTAILRRSPIYLGSHLRQPGMYRRLCAGSCTSVETRKEIRLFCARVFAEIDVLLETHFEAICRKYFQRKKYILLKRVVPSKFMAYAWIFLEWKEEELGNRNSRVTETELGSASKFERSTVSIATITDRSVWHCAI